MLKESILKFLKLDSLIEHITGYVEARFELLKMEIKEDFSKGLAKMAVYLLMGVVFMFFLILMSIAVAYLIAKSIGAFGGFAIVAGFYLLLGLLVLAFRDAIMQKVQERLIHIMKKKKE